MKEADENDEVIAAGLPIDAYYKGYTIHVRLVGQGFVMVRLS